MWLCLEDPTASNQDNRFRIADDVLQVQYEDCHNQYTMLLRGVRYVAVPAISMFSVFLILAGNWHCPCNSPEVESVVVGQLRIETFVRFRLFMHPYGSIWECHRCTDTTQSEPGLKCNLNWMTLNLDDSAENTAAPKTTSELITSKGHPLI